MTIEKRRDKLMAGLLPSDNIQRNKMKPDCKVKIQNQCKNLQNFMKSMKVRENCFSYSSTVK